MFPGRYFRNQNLGRGLGELPDTPLSEGGALKLEPPINRPPQGNQSAPTQQPGTLRELAFNQSSWQFITFSAGTTPIKLQDFLYRKYLILQNKSGAGTLYFGFGWQPNPGNGLVLGPGVGFEPYGYPTNEIWVSASVAATEGLIIYGV